MTMHLPTSTKAGFPPFAAIAYQSGFGNEFATEAVPGALPQGQNAPQKAPYGLYTEQISGTPFTTPRSANRRSWLYRIRPSVAHRPFQPVNGEGLLRSSPFDEVPAPPNQLRWQPLPIPSQPTDFIEGLVTMAGNGDAHMHTGVAIHIYAANASMIDRFFVNADGELLIVPQLGRLSLHTEMGILEIGPGEIAVIQRGIKFRVALLDDQARGYICENYGQLFRLPDLGPIGANGLANPATFKHQQLPMKIALAVFASSRNSRDACGARRSTILRWMSSRGMATMPRTNTISIVSTASTPSASIIPILPFTRC